MHSSQLGHIWHLLQGSICLFNSLSSSGESQKIEALTHQSSSSQSSIEAVAKKDLLSFFPHMYWTCVTYKILTMEWRTQERGLSLRKWWNLWQRKGELAFLCIFFALCRDWPKKIARTAMYNYNNCNTIALKLYEIICLSPMGVPKVWNF